MNRAEIREEVYAVLKLYKMGDMTEREAFDNLKILYSVLRKAL